MSAHASQLSLFDLSNSWDTDENLELDGMAFRFHCTFEKLETLKIVLDALSELRRITPAKLRRVQAGTAKQKLEPWYAEMPVFAVARDEMDDGVINIYEAGCNLIIELPDSALWDDSGLGWLTSYLPCCSRNRDNPTPWLGPNCGCTHD